MFLNKYQIPFHLFCVLIYSIIAMYGFRDTKPTHFEIQSFTLSNTPNPNAHCGFSFEVKENKNQYATDDFSGMVIHRKKTKALQEGTFIHFYLKKAAFKNPVDKINEYFGKYTIYGLTIGGDALLNVNDYIAYRKQDSEGFGAAFMILLLSIAYIYSIYWLLCILYCLLNPKKAITFTPSKWCLKGIYRTEKNIDPIY